MAAAKASTLTRHATSKGLSYLAICPSQPTRTFVCIPGGCCAATDYEPLFAALCSLFSLADAASTRLIAIDPPGSGATPLSLIGDDAVTMQSVARIVVDFVRMIAAERTAPHELLLIGHSVGCRIVLTAFQMLAGSFNTCARVSGLVLLDGSNTTLTPASKFLDRYAESAPSVSPTGASAQSGRSDDDDDDDDDDGSGKHSATKINEQAFASMMGPTLQPEPVKALLEHYRSQDPSTAACLLASARQWDVEDCTSALQTVASSGADATRVLVLDSTESMGWKSVSLREAERSSWQDYVVEKLGDEAGGNGGRAVCRTVPDCFHWVHLERPEEVARCMLDFAGPIAR